MDGNGRFRDPLITDQEDPGIGLLITVPDTWTILDIIRYQAAVTRSATQPIIVVRTDMDVSSLYPPEEE